jgi:hypothetical protein
VEPPDRSRVEKPLASIVINRSFQISRPEIPPGRTDMILEICMTPVLLGEAQPVLARAEVAVNRGYFHLKRI